eukprot:scaffold3973_cov198-Prasinococcus_capsulatus_cf.AAC.1
MLLQASVVRLHRKRHRQQRLRRDVRHLRLCTRLDNHETRRGAAAATAAGSFHTRQHQSPERVS